MRKRRSGSHSEAERHLKSGWNYKTIHSLYDDDDNDDDADDEDDDDDDDNAIMC